MQRLQAEICRSALMRVRVHLGENSPEKTILILYLCAMTDVHQSSTGYRSSRWHFSSLTKLRALKHKSLFTPSSFKFNPEWQQTNERAKRNEKKKK